MNQHRYTPDEVEYLRDIAKGRSKEEITVAMNERFGLSLTKSSVKSAMANRGIKSGVAPGNRKGAITNHRKYTPEMEAYLKSIIKGRSVAEITTMMNERYGKDLTQSSVSCAIKNRGLTSGIGIEIRYKKGHTPFNKGKKGTGGWEPTQFQKGQIPVNYRPVGSERTDTEGYVWVKVADPNSWRPKHKVVWEAARGLVPRGYALLFMDGDRQNVNVENLKLISRSQLGVMNKWKLIQKDKQINEAALLTADLILKIGAMKKKCKRKRNERGEVNTCSNIH